MTARVIKGLWTILDPTVVNVDLAPEMCLTLLLDSARPSSIRLHLREAFTDRRRYFIEPTRDGFRMATTSETLLNRRHRTNSLCQLTAVFVRSGEEKTSISVRARVRPVALLHSLWVPFGMILLLWSVPWPRPLILVVLGLLFGLASASFRYGAALEANEMMYFIHKTFEDVPKFRLGSLPAEVDAVIGGHEFEALWERFVRARQNEN